MWTYHKSPLHQSVIDKIKLENDRNVTRAAAAEKKLERDRDATEAMKEYLDKRAATLEKTARLRAERLARIAAAGPTKKSKR